MEKEIPLYAQLIHFADIVDATFFLGKIDAAKKDRISDFLRENASWFNPKISAAFTEIYMHSRSYYTGGNVKTGWNIIGNNWYYFDGSGKMQYSTVIGTNRLKEDGTMATLTTVFENVQPGKRTVKNLLQNAMLACGRTLYIWGGGWDSSDTQKIGYYPSWENFFLANGTASYNRHNFENSYGSGLDCSGFMCNLFMEAENEDFYL